MEAARGGPYGVNIISENVMNDIAQSDSASCRVLHQITATCNLKILTAIGPFLRMDCERHKPSSLSHEASTCHLLQT